MTVKVSPSRIFGTIDAISSKSMAHRVMIASLLSSEPTKIYLNAVSDDMRATIGCIEAMGGTCEHQADGIVITPPERFLQSPTLNCNESGSTARFLVPVAGSLSLEATFIGSGRLPERPFSPIVRVMRENGCLVSSETLPMTLEGKLKSGEYKIEGNVSSQYISGLLFALPLLEGDSKITLTSPLESAGYVDMTLEVLGKFGAQAERVSDGFLVRGNVGPVSSGSGRSDKQKECSGGGSGQSCAFAPEDALCRTAESENSGLPASENLRFKSPREYTVEGDWSNSAFWLCAAAAAGQTLCVRNLDQNSLQGDRAVPDILCRMGADISWDGGELVVGGKNRMAGGTQPPHNRGRDVPNGECKRFNSKNNGLMGMVTEADEGTSSPRGELGLPPTRLNAVDVDASQIPDLVPALAAAMAVASGTSRVYGASRLRLKESDRIKSICEALSAVGADIRETDDGFIINGRAQLTGGTADSHGDHRIAMMLAVAALAGKAEVAITDAQAVNKSYPRFFTDLKKLGGAVTCLQQ